MLKCNWRNITKLFYVRCKRFGITWVLGCWHLIWDSTSPSPLALWIPQSSGLSCMWVSSTHLILNHSASRDCICKMQTHKIKFYVCILLLSLSLFHSPSPLKFKTFTHGMCTLSYPVPSLLILLQLILIINGPPSIPFPYSLLVFVYL